MWPCDLLCGILILPFYDPLGQLVFTGVILRVGNHDRLRIQKKKTGFDISEMFHLNTAGGPVANATADDRDPLEC